MSTSDGREFRSFSPRQPGVVVPPESVLGRAAARVVDALDGLIAPGYDPERAAEELEVALSGLRPLLPPGEGEVAPAVSVLGDLADVVHDALDSAGVGCGEPNGEPVCFAVAEAVLAAGWTAPVRSRRESS